ncbi:MAG: hypothetical protein OEZ02_04430 [Anaerolineae bacterium]|nr:hypothetical protein [Anaerolineae bacterium]
MNISKTINHLPAELDARFRLIALLNQARFRGLASVSANGCDLQEVKDRIIGIKTRLSNLEISGDIDYLSEDSSIYLNAYMRALQESLDVCTIFGVGKSSYPNLKQKIGTILYFEGLVSSSRGDAYEFVLTCKGNLERIKAEIEEQESLSSSLPSRPSTSPLIYLRHYVLTLQEIYELLEFHNK